MMACACIISLIDFSVSFKVSSSVVEAAGVGSLAKQDSAEKCGGTGLEVVGVVVETYCMLVSAREAAAPTSSGACVEVCVSWCIIGAGVLPLGAHMSPGA